jgi:hypothetical protein
VATCSSVLSLAWAHWLWYDLEVPESSQQFLVCLDFNLRLAEGQMLLQWGQRSLWSQDLAVPSLLCPLGTWTMHHCPKDRSGKVLGLWSTCSVA